MIYTYPLLQRAYDRYNFKVITPPSSEHISLDEARDHLRITPWGSPPEHEEDAWITRNISVAREWCEGWSECALCVQTLELGIGRFPGEFNTYDGPGYLPHPLLVDNGILLPMASPFISIESVRYFDSGGVDVLADPSTYYVYDYGRPAVLYPLGGTSWPGTQFDRRDAVRVRYTCGYSLDSDSPMLTRSIPFQFKAAMLLVLGHLHENRENSMEIELQEIPLGAASLMDRFACRLGMA